MTLLQTPQIQTEDMTQFMRWRLEEEEKEVNHRGLIINLLNTAHSLVDVAHIRRRALLKLEMVILSYLMFAVTHHSPNEPY